MRFAAAQSFGNGIFERSGAREKGRGTKRFFFYLIDHRQVRGQCVPCKLCLLSFYRLEATGGGFFWEGADKTCFEQAKKLVLT